MASRLGISRSNLRQEALAGRLPCVRIGKDGLIFDPRAVEEELAARARRKAETKEQRDGFTS